MANVQVHTNSTSTVLVPAPSGPFSFIAVIGYNIISDGTGGNSNVSIQDSQGNVYDGPMNLSANDGLVNKAVTEDWLYTLPKGASLLLVQDGSANLGGSLQYATPMSQPGIQG